MDSDRTDAALSAAQGKVLNTRKQDKAPEEITINIAANGNDSTGDGSAGKPYKTLPKAVKSLIPDITKFAHGLTSRYGIYIAIFCILIIPAIYGYNHQNVVYDFTKMLSSGQNELPAEKTQFLTANNKLSEDFGINTSYIIIADAKLSALDGRFL